MRTKIVLMMVTSLVGVGMGWLGTWLLVVKPAAPMHGGIELFGESDPVVRAVWDCSPPGSQRCLNLRWDVLRMKELVEQREREKGLKLRVPEKPGRDAEPASAFKATSTVGTETDWTQMLPTAGLALLVGLVAGAGVGVVLRRGNENGK